MDFLEKYILLYFSGWLIGPIILAGAGMYAQSFLERVFSYVAVITGNMTAIVLFFYSARLLRENYLSKLLSFLHISERSLEKASKRIEGKGLFLVLFTGYFLSPIVEFSIFIALGISKVRSSTFLFHAFLSMMAFSLIMLFGGLFFIDMVRGFVGAHTTPAILTGIAILVTLYGIKKWLGRR